ncbi:winged helix-turn-helix domain-containing protein [Haloglomus litoreum]|uniref:winged helix-turn-helix domain-containing protein n=1 Tax=Haloglomus litoreum TaxID=3034026 RepID=UPI0023E832DB|nr:helix-turn-helix domain-containing protein [Haloglomus sp. DT116]
MSVPSEAELRRFFDRTVAREAHRAAVATSWLSLRLLDHLYREGPASTGELARACNLDMREVRDRLEELADAGIVAEREGAWEPAADELTVTVGRDEGVTVALAVGEREAVDGTESEAEADGSAEEGGDENDGETGLLGGMVRRLGRLLSP